MKIADLPVREVILGMSFKSQAHTGGRRLPPPTPELLADVRKLAAFKRLATPAELKRRYNLTVGNLADIRNKARMPDMKPSVRAEIIAQYGAWIEARDTTPTYQALCEKHKVTHDTIMKLVAKELQGK